MSTLPSRRNRELVATAMPSTASPPSLSDDASPSPAAGAASSNFALLYIIVAVLVAVILYMAFRYWRVALSEWRLQVAAAGGHGARPAAQIGLSMDDIAALPTFTYRARAAAPPRPHGGSGGGWRSGSGKGRAAAECAVCLQELEDGDLVRVLPACRHFFHGGCIDVWLCAHPSCPVCRAHPEPELARLREGAVSPPLPQLRRCGVSPERPGAASKVLADILARSPLMGGCSTSGSKSPSPRPAARGYITSRSPSPPAAPTANELRSMSSPPPPPRLLQEIMVFRSPSPIRSDLRSPARSIAESEGTVAEVITSVSPYTVTAREDGGGSLSKSPSPVTHYVGAEEKQ